MGCKSFAAVTSCWELVAKSVAMPLRSAQLINFKAQKRKRAAGFRIPYSTMTGDSGTALTSETLDFSGFLHLFCLQREKCDFKWFCKDLCFFLNTILLN